MADPASKPHGRAVFLSYAHEDAGAARRIADALRAFGIEVWFDSNELRGGDIWDAKIRSQIKACGLFIPIVSNTTQTRREAYFRLEWKLAEDRTHLLAPGMPFLVPVVIDDTPEYEAVVPESFAKAQWTRLPGGEPTPEFVAQVKRLASDPGSVIPQRPASRQAPTPSAAPAASEQPAHSKRAIPLWFWLAGLGIAAIAIFGNRDDEIRSSPSNPPPVVAAPAQNETAKLPVADRRSIAVLPFTNMSEDAQASSFFADGVQEDLLTNLAFVGDLRVVSRTSVMQYRNTTKSIRQIATELGVGSILEGSVRRAGDRVRVTAQLIDASTDEHIWAQTYDRKVEDIFGIQGELAKSIASALKVALSAEQQRNIEKRPTDNIAAYELFLQEREMTDRDGNTRERVAKSIGLMQRAVALDPKFALAWASLGVLHSQSYFWNFDRTPDRLGQAKAAIDRALALAPDDLDVKTFAGSYYYYGYRDYPKAAEYYQQVLDVAPNHVDAIASLGFIRRREGRWKESIALHKRALEIDPRNVSVLSAVGQTYQALRHYGEECDYQKKLVEIFPTSLHNEAIVAIAEANRDWSEIPVDRFLERYRSVVENVPAILWNLRGWQARRKGPEESLKFLENPPDEIASDPSNSLDLARIHALWRHGNKAAAQEQAREAIQARLGRLDKQPGNLLLRGELLWLYCVNGDREAARQLLEKNKVAAVALNDALDGNSWRSDLAVYLAWFGTSEEAVAALRDCLKYPNAWIIPSDRFDPAGIEPIADDPKVKAFFADRSAWAPLPIE
jgi:TolB-like protein